MPRGRKAGALIATLAAAEAVTIGLDATAASAGTVTGPTTIATAPSGCTTQNFSKMVTTSGVSRTAHSETWLESNTCYGGANHFGGVADSWKNGDLACEGYWVQNTGNFTPNDLVLAFCTNDGNTQPAGASWYAGGQTATFAGGWYYTATAGAGPAYT
jgi:hypothetical protein